MNLRITYTPSVCIVFREGRRAGLKAYETLREEGIDLTESKRRVRERSRSAVYRTLYHGWSQALTQHMSQNRIGHTFKRKAIVQGIGCAMTSTSVAQAGDMREYKVVPNHVDRETHLLGHHGRSRRFFPKVFRRKKEVAVEDLSEKLVPVIGKAKFAAVIHNLFTHDECDELIDMTEGMGFEDAMIQDADGAEVLEKNVRNCDRRIVDDAGLAGAWFRRVELALEGAPRLKEDLVRAKHVHVAGHHYGDENVRHLRVCGLNERLRFLRYKPGQYFTTHQDLSYRRGPEFGEKSGETSYLTFLLYLNDVTHGGQTRFESGEDDRWLDIEPKVGSVLIFDHDILHKAVPVCSGTKYCCRSDLMYTESK